MKTRWKFLLLILLLSFAAWAARSYPAHAHEGAQSEAATKDVDPLALDVLRAVTQPIEQAQSFSFRALVSEEDMGTDGQIITFFHTVDVTVQRPDKIRLVFKGMGQQVEFYGDDASVTMYAPGAKLYTTLPTKKTLDETLADLREKGVDMPIGPFLRSDLYEMVSKSVMTGYVIGRVNVFDDELHQLAFTAPDADFQLWVKGGPNPRIVRSEVISKKLDGKPRTIIQFLDWDLTPKVDADEFKFSKPADAHEISMLSAELQPGGRE